MSASIILDKDCEAIQSAMAVALLQYRTAVGLTLEQIGKAMEREKSSVANYINGTTEMPATCWLKATAKWPELQERMLHNLDDAEKAFQARQRTLDLEQPQKLDRAA